MAGKETALAQAQSIEMTVTLLEVVYSSIESEEENDNGFRKGFAVWWVSGQDGQRFRVSADLPAEAWGNPGQQVVLAGHWIEHPKHGRQLQAESIRPYVEPGRDGLAKWLVRHAGIGPATAQQVLDALGPQALERLARDPGLLATIPGLTAERAEAIRWAVEDYRAHKSKATVLAWAHAHGFGPAQSDAIWEGFGERAPSLLTANPWILAWLGGFGFLRADALARQLGVAPAAPARLRAAAMYTHVQAAEEEGHVYLPLQEVEKRVLGLLKEVARKTGYGHGQRWEGSQVRAAVEECVRDRALILDGDRCYLPWLYQAEERVRSWIRERQLLSGIMPIARAAALASRPDIAGSLDEVQQSAVSLALSSALSVLTGGPGTGKTTTVRAILAALRTVGIAEFNLAAPTGRAARRMVDVTRETAQTIHRLLDYGPLDNGGFGPRRNRNAPLSGKLLVIDESSMVDIGLMAALVDAVPPEMAVLLVGDAQQLHPVGPGAPFHAIVEQGLAPVVTLERIYRQEEGSAIPAAAKRLEEGKAPEAGEHREISVRMYPRPPRGLSEKEREAQSRELRKQMADGLLAAVRDLRDRHGFGSDEIQVLTPIRRGPCGVAELNTRLRELLNPEGRKRGVFTVGKREFWHLDRVMQTRNNYTKGVMNGETGVIISTHHSVEVQDRHGNVQPKPGILVRFDGGQEVGYWAGDIGELSLAYAMTVHKSQGSEYPAVVLVIGWDAYLLLQRPLVYTGMTRAVKRLVILAEEGALAKAARTAQGLDRFQAL